MRQLANCSRTLCLAALASRCHKHHDEAVGSLLSPSGLLLLPILSTVNASTLPSQAKIPAPSINNSLLTNHQQQKQKEPLDHLGTRPDAARWASASPVHPRAAATHTGSNSSTAPAPEVPDPSLHQQSSPISTLPWPPSPPPSHLDLSSTPPSSSPLPLSSNPDQHDPVHSYTPPITPSSPPQSPASSYSPSSVPSPSPPAAPAASVGYNEPRDGSFSGRIVQHDGSHAVHLLVSGTHTRDYHLRMVRCHARDELLFGPAPGGGTPGAPASFSEVGGPHGHHTTVRGEDVSFGTFMYRQVRDTITATFLPAGYPDTTGQNYVKFMSWQGVNNVAVTANSVLASTFMLYAVGLGAGSIPTAGALNWVLKDGMGQLGTLLFGKTIAHNFDVHSKTWFFLSAVMLQAAAALELLTVLAPQHFLLMGSLANTLKGLAWMAAGSTRSVFHLSFARDNNIADVTAKGTSQYIFASLVGTAGGALMCAAVGQSGAAAATCFGLLATAAVGSAYMTVQAIPLTTLNATRLQLLVDAFLDSISPGRHGSGAHGSGAHGSVKRQHGHSHHHPHRASGAGADGGSRSTRKRHGADGGGGGVGGCDSEGAGRFSTRGGGGGSYSRYGTYEDDDEDDEYEYEDCYTSTGGHHDVSRSGGGGSRSGSSATRRWSQQRAYRTVDRCYIGPSVHEYEMMYDDSLEPRVPTPLEVTPLDPPLPLWSRAAERLSPRIIVGSKLEHMVEGNANLLVMLLTTFKYAHFMVLPRPGSIHVLLHDKAEPRDMVQAYLQACILRRRMRGGTAPLPDPDEQTAELRLELQESLAAAERLTTVFMSAVEAHGWTVSKIVVEAQRRRANW